MMANRPLHATLNWIQRISDPAGGGVTDSALLKRFVSARDESAFSALVARHGGMVQGVCRRLLGHEQDAEDAFQATFLILARKAGAVSCGETLSGWLYRVAYHAALAAKTRMKTRTVHERPLVEIGASCAIPRCNPVLDELDDAVASLPEKYRTAVVFCYLEGRTYEEAARFLGCPAGTVAVRISRAKKLLRRRLGHRGILSSSGICGSAFAALKESSPTVSAHCAERITRTVLAASLAGSTRTDASALAEGLLRSMFMARLRWIGTTVLAVTLAVGGTGALAYQLQGAPVPQKEDNDPTGGKSEERIKALELAGRKAAQTTYDAVWEAYQERRRTDADVYQWSVRVYEVQRGAATNKAERIAAAENHLKRMKDLEKAAPAHSTKLAPMVPGMDPAIKLPFVPDEKVNIAEFYRIEAELWLERARAGK
jgi:RNA polymerase sigma factor (sigma-70 family)